MNNNPEEIHSQQIDNDDLFLIQEDEEVFSILIASTNKNSKHDELLGMVAYAKYSLQKHQYVSLYKRENRQLPSKEVLKAIITPFKDENSDALSSLKQSSEQFLKEYTQEYLENTKQEKIIQPLEKVIEKNTNFWVAVWAGIVGAFIYSVIIALVILIVTAAIPNNKFARIIKILLEDNTTEIKQPPQNP
ncbi:hypothetical protein [Crocosphaera sp.]|uniref:hypothetical protein n=1 Tax=Crocosphaera sp. TaxID=2729996 RepID=UPI00261D9023|nr:hypothetical protein [Crocosphaera sp.]MDJ0581238.1 hypothetical protein [Crocosphaera sp.]